jgi:protein-S-isoprenylcysteine O-methyltransferase Ste14
MSEAWRLLGLSAFSWATLASWAVFLGYWLSRGREAAGAVQQRGALLVRLAKIAVTTLFIVLLYWPALFGGWLGMRLAPDNVPVGIAGALVSAAGVACAIWARRTLGRNWSDLVVIKKEHALVQTGPYRWVRHPIYAGGFAGIVGSAITVGEVRSALVVAFVFLGLLSKARSEEALLASAFPQDFPAYKQRTRALIPFIV